MQQLERTDNDIASSLMANVDTSIYFELSDINAKRLREGFSGVYVRIFRNWLWKMS